MEWRGRSGIWGERNSCEERRKIKGEKKEWKLETGEKKQKRKRYGMLDENEW